MVSILGGSRLLQSVSKNYDFLKIFSDINYQTHTPIISILFISIFSLLFLFIKDIEKAVIYTNYLFFIVLIMINISLFFMHYDVNYKDKLNNCSTSFLNKYFPVTPLLSIICTIFALIFSIFYFKKE